MNKQTNGLGIKDVKVFEYIMLDAAKSDEEKKLFDEPKKNIDMDALHMEGANTAADGVFNTFFEEPADEEMVTSISLLFQSKQVKFDVYLTPHFYNKLIGKYMNKNELLEKLIRNMEKVFKSVCWKGVAKKGGCGGHCH
jgi:hypothetical protein